MNFRHKLISCYNCIQNKTSPNIGSLCKGVLIPRLLNNPFASCFLINFEFLAPYIAHLDNIIGLSLLVFETTGLMFSVFFFYFLFIFFFAL